jgi:mono/diheme cytochrome c family protein
MTRVRLATSVVAAVLLLGPTSLAQADKKAERAWKSKCASCHGAAGKGDTDKGKELKIVDMSTPAFQAKKDDDLRKAILEGVEKEKGHSFKSELAPDQVDALVAYVRAFKK